MSRFEFVHDHREACEVKRLCEVLQVNRSSYYKWLSGLQTRRARQRATERLAAKIRESMRPPAAPTASRGSPPT